MVGFENYSTTSTRGNQPVIMSSSRFSAIETVPTLVGRRCLILPLGFGRLILFHPRMTDVGNYLLFLSTRTTANLSLRWLPSISTSIDKWSSLIIGSG